jgi:hypothetical protein
MKIEITFDTDSETAYNSIITMLEHTLPYMVDNVEIK